MGKRKCLFGYTGTELANELTFSYFSVNDCEFWAIGIKFLDGFVGMTIDKFQQDHIQFLACFCIEKNIVSKNYLRSVKSAILNVTPLMSNFWIFLCA